MGGRKKRKKGGKGATYMVNGRAKLDAQVAAFAEQLAVGRHKRGADLG